MIGGCASASDAFDRATSHCSARIERDDRQMRQNTA